MCACSRGRGQGRGGGAAILQEEHSLDDDITETSRSERSPRHTYLSVCLNYVSILDESEEADEYGHLVFAAGSWTERGGCLRGPWV